MPPQELRPYQRSGRAKIFAAWKGGARSVLAVSPTGSGKTTLFADAARHFASSLSAPVVILVHRRELATQAANRLQEFGVDFGYILAGAPRKPYARVQIAGVQTLVRRKAPPARLVICDEAHLSTAATWSKILECYPESLILGVTATPWRLSGKPLAGAYDSCVVVAHPRELREQGHLCDYSGFSYKAPDLSGVRTTGGDYNERESAEAMREPSIVTNIVEKWHECSRDLSTVVFAVTTEHSKALAKQFLDAGVQAEHLDGETPLSVRAAILRRVDQGHTRVLCNVGVAIEGLDIPRLKCCVLARPTKSLARYMQMGGRVRRPCRRCLACGQDYVPERGRPPACPRCKSPEYRLLRARIHDHAFLIKRHGLLDDDRDYTLVAEQEEAPTVARCPECFANYRGPRCPECQAAEPTPTEKRELVTVDDAELFEFDSTSIAEITTKADPPKPEELPVVAARWDNASRERQYEGRYYGFTTQKTSFGEQRVYGLRGGKRLYALPGCAALNRFFASTPLETLVRVTYLGETMLAGNRSRKEFRLEVDDGS